MPNEVLKELEPWQESTILALIGQRQELVNRANETIAKITQAIQENAKLWSDRAEGKIDFEQRDGKFLLVRMTEEANDSPGLAPAA